jgi:DNA (cytosine-5)-methyltransferase 1
MERMPMTFGSLFAGIGGFDLGLERAGMTCKWQVEIDNYASRVLAKHWPDVPRHDDVRTFPTAGRDWAVDVICGGFPCQDISVAGKGAGLAGARSGLWYEFARIIGELRPRYVIVENVAALLGRGMDVVLGTLSSLGYDAEWHIIPASAVGAPHRRERVWIIAYAIGQQLRVRGHSEASGPPGGGKSERYQWQRIRAHAGATRQGLPDADNQSESDVPVDDVAGRGLSKPAGRNGWWSVEPDVGRVANGVPSRVDRLRCLGNAVVPQIVEVIGRAIIEAEAQVAECP